MTIFWKIEQMSIVLTMLICCFPGKVLLAQGEKDSLEAVKLLQQAQDFANQKSYEESTKKALLAALDFRTLEDWENYKEAYQLIFYNAYYTNNFSSAISNIEEGLDLVPETNQSVLGFLNYYLGFMYERIGENFTSLRYYETSSSFFSIVQDTLMLSAVYINLGIGYTQTGDYSKAIDHSKNALIFAKGLNNNHLLYQNFKSLGDAYYFKGDLKEAEQAYRKAQYAFDPKDGTFEFFKARLQLEQGKLKEAVVSIKKAIDLSGEDNGTEEAEKLLGEIYLEKGEPEKAIELFLKVLPAYKAAANRRELGKLYVLLGEAQKKYKQTDKALKYYQSALRTFLPEFINEDPGINPDPEQFTREIWLMEIFRGKGACFLQKYDASQNSDWLFLAEKQLQLAVQCIRSVKLAFDETESKLSTREHSDAFYEDLIKIKLTLFEITGQKKYQEEAFLVAQESNAFVLRELLNEQKALQVAGVAEDTISLLKHYRERLVVLNNKIAESTITEQDSLQQLLFDIKQKLFKLKELIKKEHPLFARLRSDLDGLRSQEIQRELNDSEALIKYFLGEETLYIFSVSNLGFELDTVSIPSDFGNLITRYRKATSDLVFINDSLLFAEQEYLKTAHQLFQFLLEKPLKKQGIGQDIQRLIIIADDILNIIPFQALLLKASDNWLDVDNFVISRYAVKYLYFCKMLTSQEDRINHNKFVSFGLEFDDYTLQGLQKISQDSNTNKTLRELVRSESLSRLPFSDDEAIDLADLMEGQYWVNEEATKTNFLEHSLSANFIHLATHSILDEETPNRSALIFSRTKDSLDNFLRLEEIYDLSFTANMIVLSSCSSGFGKNQKGEGLNSLARAFNFSGISSVTATFWNISDEVSKKMMLLYYEFLLQGLPKDIALQKAQLEYLRNDEISSPAFRIPVYWAAWKPIGQNDAVYIKKEKSSFLFLIIFILCLVVGITFLRKRKIPVVS